MLPSASPWFHVPWVGEAGGGLIRSCSRCFDGASHRRGKGRTGKAILDKMKSIKPEANFDTALGAVAMACLAQDTLQTLITTSGYTLVALTEKSCNLGQVEKWERELESRQTIEKGRERPLNQKCRQPIEDMSIANCEPALF